MCAELAIPDAAAARFEGGVFGVSIGVGERFPEGLGFCDAGRDEVDLIIAVDALVTTFALFIRPISHICFPKVSRQKIGLVKT